MINKVQVGKQAASWGACPAVESPNIATYFSPRDLIYMTAFYHDQLAGVTSTYKLIQPNGVVWSQWTHASSTTYDASYWYWYDTLPTGATNGTWTFQVQYITGPVVSTTFSIGPTLPVKLQNFAARATAPYKAVVEWAKATETNNKGFQIQRSRDGVTFQTIGWVPASGNSVTVKNYTFNDDLTSTPDGCKKAYYHLQQEDADGKTSTSKTILVQWANSGKPVVVFPNPAKEKITIQGNDMKAATLLDAVGRKLASLNLQNYSTSYSVIRLQPGKYTLQIRHANGTTTIVHFPKY